MLPIFAKWLDYYVWLMLFILCLPILTKILQMPMQPVLSTFSPTVKLLLLLSLFILFLGVASVLQVVILAAYSGTPAANDITTLLNNYSNPKLVQGMKMAQAISVILTFIVPALLFALLTSPQKMGYLKLNQSPPLVLVLATLLLVFAMMPLINYLGELNSRMQLPACMAGIEEWMKNSEEELKKLTEAFLMMNGVGDLFINLFIVALLAAVGEEFFFRGSLQNILAEWMGNPHIAIIATSVLFSALHMQFLGFVPRMVLGVVLGYLYAWSRSLWVPILFHFMHNGAAVLIAYCIHTGSMDKEVETIGTNHSARYYVISCLILSAGLLYFIYKKRVISPTKQE
jgi:uncharacterized protein